MGFKLDASLGHMDLAALNGDFGAWYEQVHASLMDKSPRSYPASLPTRWLAMGMVPTRCSRLATEAYTKTPRDAQCFMTAQRKAGM